MGAAATATILQLRQLVEQRFPDAAPITHRTLDQVATGIATLDRILPSGGFPRGRLSVWAPAGGATAILRAACQHTTGTTERAAWIDGNHTIAGDRWLASTILLRPRSRKHALRAAEELLRSGGFALVVLDGTDPKGTETVRLTRAARDGGSALVTLTTLTTLSSVQLVSTIRPHDYRWIRSPFNEPASVREVTIHVNARTGGRLARSDVTLPVTHHELRLSLDPGLVDRRGVKR